MDRASDDAYEIIGVLGEGGMGRVYHAVQRATGRPVALKTLRDGLRTNAARRRLLLDEASAAARLVDPRVVELLDVREGPDGAPELVFELVVGHDLDRWRASWPGFPAIAAMLDDVLGGLAEAHAAGIIHRDLKPSNVLVTADGPAKIADFGIARILDPLGTAANVEMFGTPEYMAPEQIRATEPIGPWTDLYALGVMMFELLSGSVPFPGLVPAIIVGKLTHPAPPLVPRDGLGLPVALVELVGSLLARSTRARPRFASLVRARLAELAPLVSDRGAASASTRSDMRTASVDAQTSSTLTRPSAEGTRTSSGTSADEPSPRPGVSVGTTLVRLREMPLAAREDERAQLASEIENACNGTGSRCLVLVGVAGVGKSRLARWGLADVERRGTMEGVQVGYDVTGTALVGGLRRALARLLGKPEADNESLRWIDDGEVDVDALGAWLREDPRAQPAALETIVKLVHAALRSCSRVRPVYLWVDDIGWSNDGATELVLRLLDDERARVLSVVTMRAGTADHPRVQPWLEQLQKRAAASVCELGPLRIDARVQLLHGLATFAPGVAEQMARALDGTPLQVLHLTRAWLDEGLLVPTPDGLMPRDAQPVQLALASRSIASLLGERSTALCASMGGHATAAERVLSRAALLGMRFEAAALRAACAGDDQALGVVDLVLDRALLLGMLRFSGDGTYELEHPLLHEHLLERLATRADAAPIITATVAAIAGRYGRHRADVGARAAHLLRQAGAREAAWDMLLTSIDSLSRTSAIDDAAEHLGVARRWLVDDAEPLISRRRGAVELAEAALHYWALRYEDAFAPLARARTIVEALGDSELQVQVGTREAALRFYRLELTAARALCLQLLESAPDTEAGRVGIRIAADWLAQLACFENDFESAQHWALRFSAACAGANRWFGRLADFRQLELDIIRGDLEAAVASQERIAAAFRETGELDVAFEVATAGALVALERGHWKEARMAIAKRIRQATAAGDQWILTSLRAIDTRAAIELEDGPERARIVEQFVTQFDRAAPDGPSSIHCMRAIIRRLDELGETALAASVRDRRIARDAAYAKGFGRA